MNERVESGQQVGAEVEHIEKAERDFENARAHGDGEGRVKVHFLHLRDLDEVDFRVDDDMTLGAIWEKAYLKFEVERDDRDVLQAPAKHQGGQVTSLMPYLGLTLKQARHDQLCERDFEIAGRTGGA